MTVEPSSYWNAFNPPPLYDSSPGDLPQSDGSATLAKFLGATADGTWTLFLADSDQTPDYPNYLTDPVSISGWQLILTYSTPARDNDHGQLDCESVVHCVAEQHHNTDRHRVGERGHTDGHGDV
jgi:hypothetical protein